MLLGNNSILNIVVLLAIGKLTKFFSPEILWL
jgi:hypothetical protein